MNKIPSRKILKENLFTIFLVKNAPDHEFLTYKSRGSKSYTAITSWCKVDSDLIMRDGIEMTNNDIIYHREKDAFVFFNPIQVNFNFSFYIEKEVLQYLDLPPNDEEDCFVKEERMPTEFLSELESKGIISKSIPFCEGFIYEDEP